MARFRIIVHRSDDFDDPPTTTCEDVSRTFTKYLEADADGPAYAKAIVVERLDDVTGAVTGTFVRLRKGLQG